MVKRLYAAVLAMVLVFSLGLSAYAAGGTDGGAAGVGTAGNNTGMTGNQSYVTAANNDTDWGWLGLLGLIGLGGLMGRNRSENTNRGS